MRKYFFTAKLAKLSKKEDYFFATNLEKNISTPANRLFSANQKKKNKTKKNNFCKAILLVLTASP